MSRKKPPAAMAWPAVGIFLPQELSLPLSLQSFLYTARVSLRLCLSELRLPFHLPSYFYPMSDFCIL